MQLQTYLFGAIAILAASVAAAPAKVTGTNNACYYKRDADGSFIARSVACKVASSTSTNAKRDAEADAKPPADNACYYKRAPNGDFVAYKRSVGTEVACSAA